MSVFAKLALKEIQVRVFLLPFLPMLINSNPAASGCTDIDECEYFNDPWFSGSLNFTYYYPTFRNLPEDQWTWSFYEPQPCPSTDACVNVFYKDGQGFKCVPSDQTFAAVVIGGLDWNRESEVLKADLSRCDGAIPSLSKELYHHRVRLQSGLLSYSIQAAMLDKWLLVCGGFYYGTDTHTENSKVPLS